MALRRTSTGLTMRDMRADAKPVPASSPPAPSNSPAWIASPRRPLPFPSCRVALQPLRHHDGCCCPGSPDAGQGRQGSLVKLMGFALRFAWICAKQQRAMGAH
jgi:hypothetical protein